MTEQSPTTTAAAELEGMRLVSDGGEPWATRLAKEPPVHVARACGALGVVTGSRVLALKAAWTLHDAGLLVGAEEATLAEWQQRADAVAEQVPARQAGRS